MGFVAGSAGLGQVSLLAGMAFPTGGLGVNNLSVGPVTNHATVGGRAVIAVWTIDGHFQRAGTPLIVAARGEQCDEKGADKQDNGEAFHGCSVVIRSTTFMSYGAWRHECRGT